MAQREPHHPTAAEPTLASVGSVARQAGLVVVVATLPLAVGSLAGLLSNAPSVAVGLAAAGAALEASPTLGTGLQALFGLATLATLSGCWSAGLGIVLQSVAD